MKIHRLITILIFAIFVQQGWAPPPWKGGTAAAPDIEISKCDLNPSRQTKVKIKDKEGKEHFICTGQAACGRRTVPVTCKVSEKGLCPIAKKCIKFVPPGSFLRSITCKGAMTLKIKHYLHIQNANPPENKTFKIGPECSLFYTGNNIFIINGTLSGDPKFTNEDIGRKNLWFEIYFGTKLSNWDPENSLQVWHLDFKDQRIIFPLVFKPPFNDSAVFKDVVIEGTPTRKFTLNLSEDPRPVSIEFQDPKIKVIMELKGRGLNFEADGIPSQGQ